MVAVIFDVDDTLYDQMVPFQRAYEAAFGKYNVDLMALYKASRKRSDEVFEASQSGRISMEDMYAYRITKAMEDVGEKINRVEALEFQRIYGKNQGEIKVTEGMQRILEFCKQRKVKLGVITNGPSQHQWKKINSLNLTNWIEKEHIFVSADVGAAKPELAIFNCVQRQMSLEPESTYFIGDSYENDVLGAQKAGWKTIWINRRQHLLLPEEDRPDYIVVEEESLFQILEEVIAKK